LLLQFNIVVVVGVALGFVNMFQASKFKKNYFSKAFSDRLFKFKMAAL